jgi:hypothetical protein
MATGINGMLEILIKGLYFYIYPEKAIHYSARNFNQQKTQNFIAYTHFHSKHPNMHTNK